MRSLGRTRARARSRARRTRNPIKRCQAADNAVENAVARTAPRDDSRLDIDVVFDIDRRDSVRGALPRMYARRGILLKIDEPLRVVFVITRSTAASAIRKKAQ